MGASGGQVKVLAVTRRCRFQGKNQRSLAGKIETVPASLKRAVRASRTRSIGACPSSILLNASETEAETSPVSGAAPVTKNRPNGTSGSKTGGAATFFAAVAAVADPPAYRTATGRDTRASLGSHTEGAVGLVAKASPRAGALGLVAVNTVLSGRLATGESRGPRLGTRAKPS